MTSATRFAKHRRGGMAVEAAISVGLMAVVFMLVTQSLTTVAAQRRQTEARRAAAREAANVMERLMVRPFDALEENSLETFSPSDYLLRLAPTAEVQVALADAQPGAKRLRVRVVWTDPVGRSQTPAELTAWKHRATPSTAGRPQP